MLWSMGHEESDTTKRLNNNNLNGRRQAVLRTNQYLSRLGTNKQKFLSVSVELHRSMGWPSA